MRSKVTEKVTIFQWFHFCQTSVFKSFVLLHMGNSCVCVFFSKGFAKPQKQSGQYKCKSYFSVVKCFLNRCLVAGKWQSLGGINWNNVCRASCAKSLWTMRSSTSSSCHH